MAEQLRLLIVEDDEADAELLRLELESNGFDLDWRRVDTEEDLVAALEEVDWDLIVSDFAMPSFNGVRAFEIYREHGADIPFIFVSGALGEERAVEAMRAGAHDYLVKGQLARLGVAVRRELAAANQRRSEAEARARARRERRRLEMAVEATGAGVFECDIPMGPEAYFNRRCAEMLGYDLSEVPSGGELAAWVLERVHPEDRIRLEQPYKRFTAGHGERLGCELCLLSKGEEWIDVAAFLKCERRTEDGRAQHVVGSVIDVSEQKQLEAEFRQAQKMEAIGRLAGGVAHDFNNLLTAIFAFGRFVTDTLPEDSPARADMHELLNAAKRAENLTGQLLAFSRRQTISPKVLNLNDVVSDVDRMIGRLLGEDIDVSTVLEPDLWNVRADRGVTEQVIMNLAVNARDAMPEGGKLTIETQNVELDLAYAAARGAKIRPGSYVMLALSDTGVGMDEETRQNVFEPFFTTKEAGTGTGLGLSTCYGIVKQADGYIWVYSELGEGTTFKVYLPRVEEEVDVSEAAPQVDSLDGTEAVLIAEDDDHVREIATRALQLRGYRITEACNGAEALAAVESAEQPPDLLLTDVVMPGMSGDELADRLRASHPGLRVLYMTGYTSNAIVHRGMLRPGAQMVQKPFTPDGLARSVREALDRGPTDQQGDANAAEGGE